jgi:sugar phosphate isomerase/epimerase
LKTEAIALQLYTLRALTAQNMEAALRQVAEIGYRAVELAGYGDLAPARLREVLDRLGIKAVSAHVPLVQWESDAPRVIEEMLTLGCEYAVVPWLPEERRGAQALTELASSFNLWGRRCQENGLRFAYHNHAFEFEPRAEGTLWQLLTSQTDPALVFFELDLYWAKFAQADPLAVLGQYAGRLPLLHMKDMSSEQPPRDVPVGAGILPWPEILAAAAAGTAWYVVELDKPTGDGVADIRTSLAAMRRLLGTQG